MTAVGRSSLANNTTGDANTAVGRSSLGNNTTGSNNCAMGKNALAANTTASTNTAFGYYAMPANTTGANNTAIGSEALKVNQTGGANVCVGDRAGQAFGGSDSTFIGMRAGETTTGGGNNVCIGKESVTSSSTTSNQFVLGNSSTNNLTCNDTSISSLSDGRDKTEIIDLPIGLDFINSVRPVKFKWASRDGKQGRDGKYQAGFIAQELQSSESSSSSTYLNLVQDDNPEKLHAKQGNLIPVMVQAIKELSAKNDALAAEVEQLKSQLNN